MRTKTIVIILIAAGAFGAAGWGAYRLGLQRGIGMSASTQPHAGAASKAPPAARVDPANWGIPEGEAATRRHMQDGLKASMVDPVTGRKILYYHDPMTPGKKFDAPGKSPFMDMMLVPAYAGSGGTDDSAVTVSSRIQQNLGLRSAPITEGSLAPEVSAVGTVAWNERDQSNVQARAMGYVEKLYVRAALDRVRKGEPLLDLYVPDWVAAQEDFLSIRRMRGADTATLEDAARARMRQAGMDAAQIALVAASGQVQRRLTIRAPIGGVVTDLAVREGMTVMPGMTLARINGLATVWVNAEVPESQVALLRPGARVEATSPALPGQKFEGRVQALLPEVNPQTRTLTARMEIANPGLRLVPGMFVQASLSGTHAGQTMLAPTEAIIHTGKRSLVMVADEGGSFHPVEVETGAEANGQTEIRRGVQVGQRVVVSGQFLIDSEASLQGIEARLDRGSGKGAGPADAAGIHRTTAHVEAISGDTLTLTHPAIPALKWPPMTMDFELAPGVKAQDIRAGQEVEISFRMREDDGPQIVTIGRAASAAASKDKQ